MSTTDVDEGVFLVEGPAGERLRIRAGGALREIQELSWTRTAEDELVGTGADLVVITRLARAEDSVTVSVSVHNPGGAPVRVTPLQPLVLELDGEPVALSAFTSGWGMEYEPVSLAVGTPQTIGVTTGRSAQGHSPWLMVQGPASSYAIAPHWSGNWQISTEPTGGGLRVVAGLAPGGDAVELAPGDTVDLPPVTVGIGSSPTQAARGLASRALRHRPSGPPLLTEWNHWWPYEDQEITEDVFLENAALAADLGLEVAVLDAGWFGSSAADADWVAERGDWHRVNGVRFPHGLAWLADQTRARGIEFGIWIEGEAVGRAAELRQRHPELLATSSGPSGEAHDLGYVCLGAPAAVHHIVATVSEVLRSTRARWLKWDFNLDPGAGCDRSDHGHRGEEGLLQHYLGLYQVLDRLRADFPDTVLEACSSGGLRIDLGLAEHVDAFFLSDPDWTEHHLGCLWGACQLLPPRQLLHWPQSEWRGEHRFQHADYSGTLMTAAQFDLKMQAAMLHRFGVSVRLPEMRADLRERLAHHVEVFQSQIRPLLEEGLLVPLNGQPLREERGNRRPAFQLSSGDDHLVGAFRLPPAGDWEPVRPQGLEPDARYAVRVLDVGGGESEALGRELMGDGIPLPVAASSTLVLLRRL